MIECLMCDMLQIRWIRSENNLEVYQLRTTVLTDDFLHIIERKALKAFNFVKTFRDTAAVGRKCIFVVYQF